MKRVIKAWYTGEPSSTDLGQAISESYKRMKEKYSPFDISNWYIMKPSLTSNGYSIELEFGRGDMYQWILREPESYREGYKFNPTDAAISAVDVLNSDITKLNNLVIKWKRMIESIPDDDSKMMKIVDDSAYMQSEIDKMVDHYYKAARSKD